VSTAAANFAIGQLVHHRLFDYRGVVADVDPHFRGSEEWYDAMARSRPPKDRPWYHVLVDGAVHRTYVAERNLEADDSGDPIRHPELDDYFKSFDDGRYLARRRGN
jgi:heat shock protein HspQ